MPYAGQERESQPCAISQQLLADTQAKLLEKTTLEEFLNEDTSMSETIDNLHQVINHIEAAPAVNTVTSATMVNLRRALSSLTQLSHVMGCP